MKIQLGQSHCFVLRGVANDRTTNHLQIIKSEEVMKIQLGQSHCFMLRGVANDRTTNYLLIIESNEVMMTIQLGQSHCFKPKVLYYTALYCTVLYCTEAMWYKEEPTEIEPLFHVEGGGQRLDYQPPSCKGWPTTGLPTTTLQ